MSLLREYIRETLRLEQLSEATKAIDDVKTVGDFKALISHAQNRKRAEQGKEKIKGVIKDAFWAEITGKVPGLSAAKTVYDAMKSSYSLPDGSRTGTALDYLDVDDKVSEIVDDPIENAFLKTISKKLESLPDNTPLSKIDITSLLSKYIAVKFKQRTVAGY